MWYMYIHQLNGCYFVDLHFIKSFLNCELPWEIQLFKISNCIAYENFNFAQHFVTIIFKHIAELKKFYINNSYTIT